MADEKNDRRRTMYDKARKEPKAEKKEAQVKSDTGEGIISDITKKRGGEATRLSAIADKHVAERHNMKARHEAERRDQHGNHRDEHRDLHAKHEEEHSKVKDADEKRHLHRRHERELAELHHRHHAEHVALRNRQHGEHQDMHQRHEAEMDQQQEPAEDMAAAPAAEPAEANNETEAV